MKQLLRFLLILPAVCGLRLQAGEITYVPIPASASDASSGISSDNAYTSAVDGGNASGTDRVINGITLYSLAATGQTSTADGCTLNALAGSLSNKSGSTTNVPADGTLAEVLSDMTINNGAGDNSQQEIVLDPASLTAGTTYDLRVYVSNSNGKDRQINLAFAGDGQPAVETGFFNEDDATTTAGGFTVPNQVYYINYRYTWDGDSTPGITITQKHGSAPFVFYALTNQVVNTTQAAAPASGEALSMASVSATSDQVGAASDLFYTSDTLNKHGRWIKVGKYGTCWQPTDVPKDWRPYTNGSWRHCDDAGWIWVTDEEWGWATYHYGRWFRTEDVGWCWVPGTVWAPSWVSWRQGATEECSCTGWAPLPPEAACDVNVGVSTWVDRTCDIGPDAYTFINIRDFGTDSYSRCGCIYGRDRNVTIINETVNITNIVYNNRTTYCGGPDYRRYNDLIRRNGGREIGTVTLDRVASASSLNGRHSRLEGNTLALVSPLVPATKTPQHLPNVATTLPAARVDKGWAQVKDPKIQAALKSKIADETKGATPKTAVAKLPADVAAQVTRTQGQKLAPTGGAARALHPGQTIKSAGVAGQVNTNPAKQAGLTGQHPGERLVTGNGSAAKTSGHAVTGSGQHPGQVTKEVGAAGKVAGVPVHPGQSIKPTNSIGQPAAPAHPASAVAGVDKSSNPQKAESKQGSTSAPSGTNHPKDLMGATKDSGSRGPVESAKLPSGKKSQAEATHIPDPGTGSVANANSGRKVKSHSSPSGASAASVSHESSSSAHKVHQAEPQHHEAASVSHAKVEHVTPKPQVQAPRVRPPQPNPVAATHVAPKNNAKPTPTPKPR